MRVQHELREHRLHRVAKPLGATLGDQQRLEPLLVRGLCQRRSQRQSPFQCLGLDRLIQHAFTDCWNRLSAFKRPPARVSVSILARHGIDLCHRQPPRRRDGNSLISWERIGCI